MTIRVLIADDQTFIRTGLVTLFSAAPGFEIVGAAADGRQAVELANRTSPDVILMDIRMPVLDGIAATRELLAAPHDDRPQVIVLTTFDLDEYVYAALASGASGFLLKDTPTQRIITAVQAIVAGDVLLSPAITRRLIETYAHRHRTRAVAGPRLNALTPRETEVSRLIGNGLTNAQIAQHLGLSEATVKTHVKRIMGKLGLSSRAQVVVAVYESGLITPSPPTDHRHS
ncbi:putative two-component response regulator [Nocardia brasiliensis NBRC 14402]|uniref:response regulator n=1 Tax=Nocardia brasiliensis TaxID=37326 RepID=UPI0002F60FF5|nr:response regulator transcription factor [Nocardia brasiliensis]ASF09340.1 DNA-binding response regulator [Nocardia brasiliensis]GAJ86742.1 putative two-component response regulator [Nocardia brasiliensis NBRC 14402]SUB39968.1 Response regulator protein vraR [Nocardia brasiliensis]